MQQHQLVQGTSNWLEYRRKHFNASDAPAMLGVSKYKTRTQLLNEAHTGLTQDINSATQKIFDAGHRFESLARPLAEAIIGEELSPVIGSNGKLSASFDGLTLLEDIAWEHKTLNQNIMDCVTVFDLDEMYLVQMEQQLLVSGAEKCLFMASKWDGDEIQAEKHFWYEPSAERRQQIIDGWAQFEIDLANYVPVEVVELPKAQAIMALPSLAIAIKGEVVASNLAEFKEAATEFIANIKTELVTDQDFVDADKMVGFLDDAEKNIEAAKTAAISQTASIDELMRTMDFIKAQLRDKRLIIEKLVKSEKENRKLNILNVALSLFNAHIEAINADIKPIRGVFTQPDFAGAMKGKKTLTSMQDAVDTCLANAKSNADAIARDIRAKQVWLKENADGYQMLFADIQTIIHKPMDDLQVLVKSRIAEHKEAEAAKEAKIIADANASALEKVRLAELAKEREAVAILQAEHEAMLTNNAPVETVVMKPSATIRPPTVVMHFQGVEPSVNDLVNAVAKAFGADVMMAHKWLLEADFTKFQQAA